MVLPKIAVNSPHTRYEDILESLRGDTSDLGEIGKTGGDYARLTRSTMLLLDGRNRAAAISSPEGAPSDPHLHEDFNEWWVVLGGEVSYTIGEYETFAAHFGDVVVAPAGYRHAPTPTKGDMCVRVVVGLQHSNHDLKGLQPVREVPLDNLPPPNRIWTPLAYMIERHGVAKEWSEVVLLDERNRVNMIHQLPGQSSRPHWHPDVDELWVVLKGELEWRVGARDPFRARRGDFVFVESGCSHEIVTVGDESSIRLAVTSPNVIHHYLDDPSAARPARR